MDTSAPAPAVTSTPAAATTSAAARAATIGAVTATATTASAATAPAVTTPATLGGVFTPAAAASTQPLRSDSDGEDVTRGKGDNRSGECKTPVKLTLADVESVLGAVSSSTPKSTVSSLSKFVHRVSGQGVSDFLFEFQSLGGAGEEPLAHLENLNIQ